VRGRLAVRAVLEGRWHMQKAWHRGRPQALCRRRRTALGRAAAERTPMGRSARFAISHLSGGKPAAGRMPRDVLASAGTGVNNPLL
jgi:hypothetical protein